MLMDELYKKIELTVDPNQIPFDHADFPLLINNTYPELIGATIPGLIFTDQNDKKLESKLVEFDRSAGKLTVMIKTPILRDGIVRIYYC